MCCEKHFDSVATSDWYLAIPEMFAQCGEHSGIAQAVDSIIRSEIRITIWYRRLI